MILRYDQGMNTPNETPRYFTYGYLDPEPHEIVSEMFLDLARTLNKALPDGPEKSTALRKLLESRLVAVRFVLDVEEADQ